MTIKNCGTCQFWFHRWTWPWHDGICQDPDPKSPRGHMPSSRESTCKNWKTKGGKAK
jgi:hypothetical protein